MRMLPNRLVDHGKRLFLLVGLGATGATAMLPPRARAPNTCTVGGFATATPAAPGDAAAKHSYSPRPHLYDHPPEHLQLKQIVVIARHGDRVPIARNVGSVIKDSPAQQQLWKGKLPPQADIEAWRAQYGPDPQLEPLDQNEFPYSQLTVRGAQELRALGAHLRERYVSKLRFLPHSLEAGEERRVYARATNIRRTQQSAQNLLLGLYPEGSLPIEVRPTPDETLYPNADRSCRRQEEIITELRKQHYGMPEEYKALTKTSKERLGFDSFIPWNQVREVLTCHVVHGVPLPPPVDEGYVDRVVAFTSRMWGQWFRHPEFARLGIGPFIDELLQAVDARVADASPHHMLLYAGHDSTIVPLLAAFGIYDDTWPPYSSHILLELAHHKENPQEHYVRVLYNDEEKIEWRPYHEVKWELRKLVPKDYKGECQCRQPNLKEADLEVKEDGVGSTIVAGDDKKK